MTIEKIRVQFLLIVLSFFFVFVTSFSSNFLGRNLMSWKALSLAGVMALNLGMSYKEALKEATEHRELLAKDIKARQLHHCTRSLRVEKDQFSIMSRREKSLCFILTLEAAARLQKKREQQIASGA